MDDGGEPRCADAAFAARRQSARAVWRGVVGSIHESLDCGVFSGIALHHVEVSGLVKVHWRFAKGLGASKEALT